VRLHLINFILIFSTAVAAASGVITGESVSSAFEAQNAWRKMCGEWLKGMEQKSKSVRYRFYFCGTRKCEKSTKGFVCSSTPAFRLEDAPKSTTKGYRK